MTLMLCGWLLLTIGRDTLCKTVYKIEMLVLDLSLSKASSSSRCLARNAGSTTTAEALLSPPEVKYSEPDDD